MSVIGKQPFAEQVLYALKGDQINRLSTLVNNLGNPLHLDIHSLTQGANEVEYVLLTFNKQLGIAKHGFLCFVSNDLCGFFSFQDDTNSMISYKVHPTNGAYEDMHELLSVDEFRRIIDDTLESHPEYADKITVGKIDSEESLKGQAIVSDGEGGALWGEVANIIEVEDITAMTKAQLDFLKPGDIVNKITGNAKHSYRVSYKGEGAGTGICLTYTDAGYSETVSYDRSGNDWVYNSTDIATGLPETTSATAGQVLGLDSSKNPQWQNVTVGTKLYKHEITVIGFKCEDDGDVLVPLNDIYIECILPSSTQINSINSLLRLLEDMSNFFGNFGNIINFSLKLNDADYADTYGSLFYKRDIINIDEFYSRREQQNQSYHYVFANDPEVTTVSSITDIVTAL